MMALRHAGRLPVGLIAASVAALLLLSACAPQPGANVEATAQSLARQWVAQTAEALSAVQATPSSTDTPVPVATAVATTAGPTEPPAPIASDTPTAMPTSTVAPTRAPDVPATSSPAAVLTLTAAPPCPIAVNPELVAGWDRAKLGCPTADAAVIWTAWEPFQHGEMFWRNDLDRTYALHWQNGTDPSSGDWSTGKDAWQWEQSYPDGRGLTPPAGLFEPVRGFGFAWFNFLGGPASTLGWATSQEKGFCANLQPFEKGLVVRSSGGTCGDDMYNWANDPAFAPVFATLYADGTWVRHPSP